MFARTGLLLLALTPMITWDAGRAPQDAEKPAREVPGNKVFVVTATGAHRPAFGPNLQIEAGAHVVANLGVHDPHVWIRDPQTSVGTWLRPGQAETMAAALETAADQDEQKLFLNGVAGLLARRRSGGPIDFEVVQSDGPLPGLSTRLTETEARDVAATLRRGAAEARWISSRLESMAPKQAEIAHR